MQNYYLQKRQIGSKATKAKTVTDKPTELVWDKKYSGEGI